MCAAGRRRALRARSAASRNSPANVTHAILTVASARADRSALQDSASTARAAAAQLAHQVSTATPANAGRRPTPAYRAQLPRNATRTSASMDSVAQRRRVQPTSAAIFLDRKGRAPRHQIRGHRARLPDSAPPASASTVCAACRDHVRRARCVMHRHRPDNAWFHRHGRPLQQGHQHHSRTGPCAQLARSAYRPIA